MPVNTPVPFVTPLKVYDNGAVPPDPVIVTVAVPPLHSIGEVTAALPDSAVGCVTGKVPVTGPQPLTSVMLHEYPAPDTIPVKMPVELVIPLKVYVSGDVPPEAVRVTVAVPPKQSTGDVTDAEPVRIAGPETVSVPVAGVQVLASVMFQAYGPPAGTPIKIPVAFVTPLKVYDNGEVPPDPLTVTTAVLPLHAIGVVTEADPVITAGWVTVREPVTGPQVLASVILHAYPVPATIPVKIPVAFVTPLNVYDSGIVPPQPVRVTVAVPPLQSIGDVIVA
jgi:hypothetical protein